MPANKYDAMIAAMDLLQNITDKPNWMLQEEELALREKMHDDEMEMSLMMTQIKTEQGKIDFMDKQIAEHQSTLIDVRSRIQATGADLDKMPEYETTAGGQTALEDLYTDIEQKYRDPLISLERNKRDRQEAINELQYKIKNRGDELGNELGKVALNDLQMKEDAADRENQRIMLAEETARQVSEIRLEQESRASEKFSGTDPATVDDSMNLLYSGLQTQIGKDGLFTTADMLDYAENLGGVYATNADQIANKLTILFTTSMTGESFLTALDNEDPIYKQFLMEEGMPTSPSMQQLHLLSLAGTVQSNQTGTIDANTEIEDLLKGLPPLVRRK